MADDDYFSGEYLQDIVESDLLDEAHDEAGAYVDQHFPWDGRGDEPAGRVSAYCSVLWQRAEAVRQA
jgi:hypothetical protein